ncbi:hypothetical protein P691DRAFT_769764 [Macrolepiota fuliginosa MF-IS2]|uniref:Uncharacterized protein n=1 Tax=Macrolepiota fuliginosa MF-IS2 TaxID=1400762 RepID=A0A9P5WX20_9AGAR|nr:hypothetical protein P691DRAFT_769764 [Macrolepiota fuliginosa MF-IS2]
MYSASKGWRSSPVVSEDPTLVLIIQFGFLLIAQSFGFSLNEISTKYQKL